MRDPNLVDPRSVNDIRVKPPHGRQTRVALGLDTTGEMNGKATGYSHHWVPGPTTDGHVVHSRDAYADGRENNYETTGHSERPLSAAPETVQYSPSSTSGGPKPLQRARSDLGPRHRGDRSTLVVDEDLWRMRHGWEDEYTSNEYLALLNSVSFLNSPRC